MLLDTIPDYTLVDVAQNVTRLDFTLAQTLVDQAFVGACSCCRDPCRWKTSRHVAPDDLQRVIGLLKATFTHLVLDLSKSYSALDQVALQMADQVLLVTQLDLPCLRNVVRLMTSFRAIPGLAEKVKIVVNRVGLDCGHISLKKAQETIGREIFWQITERLSHDGRSAQQRRAPHRASPQGSRSRRLSYNLADALVRRLACGSRSERRPRLVDLAVVKLLAQAQGAGHEIGRSALWVTHRPIGHQGSYDPRHQYGALLPGTIRDGTALAGPLARDREIQPSRGRPSARGKSRRELCFSGQKSTAHDPAHIRRSSTATIAWAARATPARNVIRQHGQDAPHIDTREDSG